MATDISAKADALRQLNNPARLDAPLRQPLLPSSDSGIVIDVGDESDDFKDNNLFVTILDTALNSAGHLANLLPTGTFLLFQILVPIVSNSGDCQTTTDIALTLTLLIFCGLLCLITTFTDSFTTAGGNVHYGLVTWFGLWTPQLDKNYAIGGVFKWQWQDFFHAVLGVTVFYTSTIFSAAVRYCFFPDLTDRTSNLVCNLVPPLAGFLISILFILFPSKRRGVGYPITAALLASVQQALDPTDDEAATTAPIPVPDEAVPASAVEAAPAAAAPTSAVVAAPAAAVPTSAVVAAPAALPVTAVETPQAQNP